VWLVALALLLGGLGLFALGFRPWRGSGRGDLGVMSERWLAENRAASR